MTNYQVIAREECVAKTVTPQTGSMLVKEKEFSSSEPYFHRNIPFGCSCNIKFYSDEEWCEVRVTIFTSVGQCVVGQVNNAVAYGMKK